VLYDIAVIGETANKISLSFKQQNSTVPWAAIINMRHRIVHDYGNINIQAVKEVLDNDLPILKQQIVDMLKILSS
ncbi:MAG: HepT-like ribonuclease domain-containing protein, partial [Rickettsiales bacterium]